MVVRFLTSKVLPVAGLGVAVTVYSGSAQAFFPPVPVVPTEVVVVPPVSPVIPLPPVVPPVVPPPFVPPPPPPVSVPPVVVPVDHCPTPSEVPEPATLAVAAIGLAGVGAAALRKKLMKPKAAAGE